MFKRHNKKRNLCCAVIGIHIIAQNNTPGNRKKWVKNYLIEKDCLSHIQLLKELRDNEPDDFKNYLRMDTKT